MPEHFVHIREIFRMRCFVHSGNAEVLWDLIFIRSFYKAIGQRRFWILQSMGCILQKAGEDSVALGTDFDGFEAGQNWLRGIEEIECVWDALKKAGMTERQLDKLSYQNVKRVLEEVI